MDTTDPDNRKRSLAETGDGTAKVVDTFDPAYFRVVLQSMPEWLRGEIQMHGTEKRQNQVMYAFMTYFANLIKSEAKRNQILAAPAEDHFQLIYEALIEVFATQEGTRNTTRNGAEKAKAYVDKLMQEYPFPPWNDN
jgi:hypothetical protein